MGGPRSSNDDAVSDTLGVVLMVAMSVAMAGGMYVWVFGIGGPATAPAALGLASDGPLSSTGTKTFTVASVQADILWNDLVLKVDGETLAYDPGLTGSNKFCVATTTSACLPTATWEASATPVKAGHILRIHDLDLGGKSLQVIDERGGAMILSIPLGMPALG